VALLLKSQGITRVRPLQGGVEAWERMMQARALPQRFQSGG